MKIKGQKKRPPGTTITVSRRAHATIAKGATTAKPKRSIREQVNVILDLPINE